MNYNGKHVYTIIMAGGEGTRFAPLSTPHKPKQFLNIVGEKSLLRQTFERLMPEDANARPEWFKRLFVATNARFIQLVRAELPEIAIENIIGEPVKKNTAPCIGYLAHIVKEIDPEGVMVVLPSDHVILNHRDFLDTLDNAVELAVQNKFLVTLGIKPTWPSPEYGYIEKKDPIYGTKSKPAFMVHRFVEKPTTDVASGYLSSGRYYWNSGMFIWQAKTILEEIAKNLPELYAEIEHLQKYPEAADLVSFFDRSPSISIDYGVMERTKCAAVIPCTFGWSDVGTWKSLKELSDSGVVTVAENVKKIMEAQLKLSR